MNHREQLTAWLEQRQRLYATPMESGPKATAVDIVYDTDDDDANQQIGHLAGLLSTALDLILEARRETERVRHELEFDLGVEDKSRAATIPLDFGAEGRA